MQQAARLSPSYFLQHCAWPPPRLTGGVHVAYRVWRRPLYVAGRYLKLLRGVAQVCCQTPTPPRYPPLPPRPPFPLHVWQASTYKLFTQVAQVRWLRWAVPLNLVSPASVQGPTVAACHNGCDCPHLGVGNVLPLLWWLLRRNLAQCLCRYSTVMSAPCTVNFRGPLPEVNLNHGKPLAQCMGCWLLQCIMHIPCSRPYAT